jgi:hypothetical protein
VIKKRRKGNRNLIPAWQMPADPVKAVFWFLFWFLRLLVNFFWLPILAMVVIEIFLNWSSAGGVFSGIVAGVVTLLVGLVIWALLYGVVFFLNIGTTLSRVISDVGSIQKNFSVRNSLNPFNESDSESEQNVVEGTITDLEEERRKRRQSE